MLALLQFLLTDIWHFFGACVLIIVACEGLADIVKAWRHGE